MQSTAIISDIGIDYKTNKAKITFLFDNKEVLKQAEELQDKKLNVEAKKWYRKHIYEAGTYQELQMPEEAMQKFVEIWSNNGLGWFCEKSTNQYGEIVLKAYNGSSTYDTKEMTRLVDSVVQDCREQNIETMSDKELKSLLEQWH